MEEMKDWILANKGWLFPFVGAVLAGIVGLIFKGKSNSSRQSIRSGNHSVNVQAGRDVSMGPDSKGDVKEKG